MVRCGRVARPPRRPLVGARGRRVRRLPRRNARVRRLPCVAAEVVAVRAPPWPIAALATSFAVAATPRVVLTAPANRSRRRATRLLRLRRRRASRRPKPARLPARELANPTPGSPGRLVVPARQWLSCLIDARQRPVLPCVLCRAPPSTRATIACASSMFPRRPLGGPGRGRTHGFAAYRAGVGIGLRRWKSPASA
jgi:hypothetical protein